MEWSDRGKRLVATSVVMLFLAAVFVTLRLISRGRILHILGPTDWFIIVTLIVSVLNTVALGIHVTLGLGQPKQNLSLQDIETFFKVMYGAIIINNLGLVITKISVVLLFLDVFVVTWLRKATYCVLVLAIVGGMWTLLTKVFSCVPISGFWHVADPGRKCILVPMKYYVDSACNLALDFFLLFLPLPAILRMTLPWRQKLWIYSVAALGFFVCLMSIFRFHLIRINIASNDLTSHRHLRHLLVHDGDQCVHNYRLHSHLKPLFAKFWPRWFATPDESQMGETDDGSRPPTISSPSNRPACSNTAQV
ncbi:hypothetical protein VTI74DRAFT_9080 [Chaetomium olivicolor]